MTPGADLLSCVHVTLWVTETLDNTTDQDLIFGIVLCICALYLITYSRWILSVKNYSNYKIHGSNSSLTFRKYFLTLWLPADLGEECVKASCCHHHIGFLKIIIHLFTCAYIVWVILSLLPLPPPIPLHFQAEPVLPLSLILLKRRHKHNKKDKTITLAISCVHSAQFIFPKAEGWGYLPLSHPGNLGTKK
jgi:hypothetical protein